VWCESVHEGLGLFEKTRVGWATRTLSSFGNLDEAKRQMAKARELAEGDDCLNSNLSFI